MTDDLERIAEQERRLVLDGFDESAAWRLGNRLRELAGARNEPVTIEVRLGGATVFLSAMAGTAPANADWARRKRNTVELVHRSSYAVGIEGRRDGRSLLDQMHLDGRDHADHGGAFPIRVGGVGVVGVVTVSGLPQRNDHQLVVEALAEMCGVPFAEVALADQASA